MIQQTLALVVPVKLLHPSVLTKEVLFSTSIKRSESEVTNLNTDTCTLAGGCCDPTDTCTGGTCQAPAPQCADEGGTTSKNY